MIECTFRKSGDPKLPNLTLSGCGEYTQYQSVFNYCPHCGGAAILGSDILEDQPEPEVLA